MTDNREKLLAHEMSGRARASRREGAWNQIPSATIEEVC